MTSCTLANGHTLPRPAKIECFVQTVKQHNPTCSCHEHDPTSYNAANSCDHAHQIIPWPQYWTIIHKGEPPVLKKEKAYEALHLARAAVRWIATPETHMNDKRALALARFREGSLLLGMEGRDASKSVPIHQVLGILHIYNDLFFFGAVKYSFSWRDLASRGLLGRHSKGHIEVDPICFRARTDSMLPDQRRLSRLGTLLHETIHAFLFQFACRSCPTYCVNVKNAGHHGRAFEMVATALKEATHRLLDYDLCIGGFKDVYWNWDRVRYLPSKHDLEEWRWIEAPKDTTTASGATQTWAGDYNATTSTATNKARNVRLGRPQDEFDKKGRKVSRDTDSGSHTSETDPGSQNHGPRSDYTRVRESEVEKLIKRRAKERESFVKEEEEEPPKEEPPKKTG
jgi:hypothetical protein